jgi:hypothetical protein
MLRCRVYVRIKLYAFNTSALLISDRFDASAKFIVPKKEYPFEEAQKVPEM